MRRVPAAAWLILLLVVAYADILFAGRGFFLHDLTLYHYPMKHVLRDIVMRGAFPYWNRFLSCGQPLAANPAYEVFYPPQWLIFLPSFHFGFQLHVLLHFAVAAVGMYVLARALDAGVFAALFAGISFVFCGPYLSLSSKLPLLFSYSWMPWTLALWIGPASRRRFVVIPLALQLILGEPTVLLQTVLLLGGGTLLQSDRWRKIALLAGAGAGAAALAAVQLIPAIDFARDTVRAKPFPFEVVSNWSTPPARLIELFVPRFFDRVMAENGRALITGLYPFRVEAFLPSFYLGIAVFILAMSGVVAWKRGAGIVLVTVGAFAVLALGDHTPLLRALYDAGLFRALRYPEKFMLTPALVLILWAALVLEDARAMRAAKAIGIATALLALVIVIAQPHVEPRWYAAEVVARIGVVTVALSKRLRSTAVFLAIVALDIWSATLHLVPRMPRGYFDPPPIARQIPPDGRVYPQATWDWWDGSAIATAYFGDRSVEQYWWTFRNGGFVNLPMQWDRELALEDDVDRTSLLTTDAFREEFKRARAQHAEEPYLQMTGVHSLLRFRPMESSDSTQPVEVSLTPKYPRYTLENGTVRSAEVRDNSIRLETISSAAGVLFMSVTGHRYWSATVDGRPAALQPANIAFQSLNLNGGSHVIELRYRNPLIPIAGWITLAAALALTFASVRRGRRASVGTSKGKLPV